MRVNRLPALLPHVLGLLCAACSAPQAADGRVFGEPVAKLGAAAGEPPAPVDPAPDESVGPVATPEAEEAPGARERTLRRELAEGDDPASAALGLVALLTGREQHVLALAAVETGLRRAPEDAALVRTRAGLLRDVGRRTEALQALRDWDRAHPEADPSVLLEIAELEWLRGRRTEAAAALSELERRFADHAWYERNRARLQAFALELSEAEQPKTIAVRDLLADLRGGRLPSIRLRAFHALQQASPAVQRQAVAVALADVSGAVRGEAVELAVLPADELTALCREAFGDADWQVRAAAARRAMDLPLRVAARMLVEAIAVEQESVAFQAMHEGLQRLTGEEVPLPAGGGSREDVRARFAAYWRDRWQ